MLDHLVELHKRILQLHGAKHKAGLVMKSEAPNYLVKDFAKQTFMKENKQTSDHGFNADESGRRWHLLLAQL